jgi:hypothetical protein
MNKLAVTHVSSITFVKNLETGEWEMRHHPEYIATYESLTKEELERAVGDLANASQIARRAGHATGCTLDRITGAVCMVGAIEVATYKEIFTNDVGEFYDLTTEEWVEAGVERADAAILVLAYILPSGLCSGCPVDGHGVETFPFSKITHFSDFHCTGPQQSARLLDLASTVAEYRSTTTMLRAVPTPRLTAETMDTVVA